MGLTYRKNLTITDRDTTKLNMRAGIKLFDQQRLCFIPQMHAKEKAYRSGGETPRVLPHHFTLPILVLKIDFEHFGKILAQAMRCGPLHSTACGRNERLRIGTTW